MKKLFIALLLTGTIAISAFATDAKKINVRIMNNFKSDFAHATNVSWTLRSNFAKVNFDLNCKKVEAFYNMDGECIGTSQQISVNDLPTHAKRTMAKRYAGYNVIETIEFNHTNEVAYYISAENDTEKLVLKVSDTEGVSVFKKSKKN